MLDVMEGIVHYPLKCGPCILQTEREFPISEYAPWTNKRFFRLVLWADIDLIVTRKTIHK